jgi:hypothetical protein
MGYRVSERGIGFDGIKPKMDAKRTWYMFKNDLSKTTEILIKEKQKIPPPHPQKKNFN